jgi:hypothetical protein
MQFNSQLIQTVKDDIKKQIIHKKNSKQPDKSKKIINLNKFKIKK